MEIKRDAYLEQLKIRKDNGMIKIITGIRRCGKSFLLFVLFKSNYSAPRLGYINFWSKQRKYNFCFIIALLRKVDNFSM